jgi:hypothetical protein
MAVLAGLGPVDHRVPSLAGTFAPIGVVVHHTANPKGGGAIASLKTVQEGRPDLSGPLCNVLIGRDASVNVITNGRAHDSGTGDPHVLAAFKAHKILPQPDDELDPKAHPNGHFTDGTNLFYDVEVENSGIGDEPYPEAQVEMTGRVVAAICRANGFAADRVLCHKEWTRRKIDWSAMSGGDTRALVARFLEDDDMPLNDADKRFIRDQVLDIVRQEGISGNAASAATGVLTVLNSIANLDLHVDVDEGALAKALAPALTARLGALSEKDLNDVATAVNDEQARRGGR